MALSSPNLPLEQPTVSKQRIVSSRLMMLREGLERRPGVYSLIQIRAAGFENIGTDHAARCLSCGLLVYEWPPNIEPFTLHAQRSPACSFVLSLRPTLINSPLTTATTADDQPSRQTKLDPLVEVHTLKVARQRTFSHWPHRSQHSAASMIEAGFFCCNVDDRVICLYCNLICQGWRDSKDGASTVHTALSPGCLYVTSMLTGAPLSSSSSSSIVIVNERTATSDPPTSINSGTLRCNSIVTTNACHPRQAEIPRRHASFASWVSENVPAVDDLVRAGFFYTGTQTIVTCFFCNGSLQNWGPKDNPMVEHARWFPHCAYIKQLCGSRLYQQIRDAQRTHKGLTSFFDSVPVEYSDALDEREADTKNESLQSNGNSNRLAITDESMLSRLVAARLDLPISQRLLNQNFTLSIIKRCWEDQLRLRGLFHIGEKSRERLFSIFASGGDFVDDTDLWIACTILRKQIDHINGDKKNIILPSRAMETIRQKQHGGRNQRFSLSIHHGFYSHVRHSYRWNEGGVITKQPLLVR